MKVIPLWCILVFGLMSCKEDESKKHGNGPETPVSRFDIEILIALADSAGCLHAVGQVPKLDLMETVVRDCLILNELKASRSDLTGREDRSIQYAEWKGRNLVRLLRAAEPLFMELLESLTTLSKQLEIVAEESPESGEIRNWVQLVQLKTNRLTSMVTLATEVARNPDTTYHEELYDPRIRVSLQEIVGMLLTMRSVL